MPGSLAALDELFQRDDAFKSKRPRTQRDYLYAIKLALAWAGSEQVVHLTRKAIRAWYRHERENRGVANARNAATALRRLLSFGCDEGWISNNPALKLGITTPKSRARVWSLAERDAFCAAAETADRPSMGRGPIGSRISSTRSRRSRSWLVCRWTYSFATCAARWRRHLGLLAAPMTKSDPSPDTRSVAL